MKTASKRKERDSFLLFSHTDRAFAVLCGQMAPKLNKDILVLSGCFSGLCVRQKTIARLLWKPPRLDGYLPCRTSWLLLCALMVVVTV